MSWYSVLTVLAIFLAVLGINAAVDLLSRRFFFSSASYLAASSALEAIERQRASLEGIARKLARKSQGAFAARAEADLARLNGEPQTLQVEQAVLGTSMRAQLLAAGASLLTFFALPSLFPGALLRLPFAPPPPIVWLSHRGLPGDDMAQPGAVFDGVLSNLLARPLLAALLGTPKVAGGSLSEYMQRAMAAASAGGGTAGKAA